MISARYLGCAFLDVERFRLGRKCYYRVDGRYVWDMHEGRRGELKMGMEVESVRPCTVRKLLEKMSVHSLKAARSD